MIAPERIDGATLYRITPRGRGKFLHRHGRVDDTTKVTAGEVYQMGFLPQRFIEAGYIERIEVLQEEKIAVLSEGELNG